MDNLIETLEEKLNELKEPRKSDILKHFEEFFNMYSIKNPYKLLNAELKELYLIYFLSVNDSLNYEEIKFSIDELLEYNDSEVSYRILILIEVFKKMNMINDLEEYSQEKIDPVERKILENKIKVKIKEKSMNDKDIIEIEKGR